METRELRYFVAVAEELHFGRAAARLGMAQPPLSRAIAALERRLGVTLLARTPRGATLTPPGEVLLREARAVLDALATAESRTRRAAAPAPRLRLAMKPGSDGGLLPKILPRYGTQPVDILTCVAGRQPYLLRTGEADVAFLHARHADLTGLDSEVLLLEPQVAALAPTHPLAGAATVCLADLTAAGPAPLTRDHLLADPPHALQLVALGRAVAIFPASLRNHIRRDVTCVPVTDAPETELRIAWRADSRSAAVAAFVRAAAAAAQVR